MRKNELQLANFVCTFGSNGELLTYVDELFIPTFFDDKLVRTHGQSSYYIYEPFWLNLGKEGEGDLAIAGRFVKDMTLTREQILRRGQLMEDYDEMQSSPSSFFVLLLRDHRLLYFGETSHAPEMGAFASTVQIFIRRKWREYLTDLHAEKGNKLTHKDLRKQIPMPNIDIVPVAKKAKIKELLKDFDKITRLKFRLIRPNQETDASKVFQSVRERLQPLDPARLDVELAQSQGLDHDETVDAVEEAAAGLNTDIIIRGKDAVGNALKVENQDLALRIPVADPPTTKKSLAKKLYKIFEKQIESGSLRRQAPGRAIKDKLQALANSVL